VTPTEASDLGKKIINAWHGGPPLVQWIEELEPLDAGQAGTAFVRLRRQLEHCPSIARFFAEYHALDTRDGGNTKPKCGWCEGMGWLETPRHVNRGQVYSGWEPCSHCDQGRASEVGECWTKSPTRTFLSDAEADRLLAAIRTAPPIPSKPMRGKT
jgi:hypothetical protein